VDIAHLPFEFGPGDEGGDRVDDDDVERTRADQHVGDLERLLARVGLRDQQLVDIDPQRSGVDRIERVLGVDEGSDAAIPLSLGSDVEGQCGLTTGLRSVDLDDAAPRNPSDAERQIQGQRPGRDGGHLLDIVGAEAHDGALAELPLDLSHGHIE